MSQSRGTSSEDSDCCHAEHPIKWHRGDASGLDSAVGVRPCITTLHHGDGVLGELGPERSSLAPASGLDSALGVGQCDLRHAVHVRVDGSRDGPACGLGSAVGVPPLLCGDTVLEIPCRSRSDCRLFYPYSLATCPDQNSTHKMPENKLRGDDEEARAHALIDHFLADNLPSYNTLCGQTARAPAYMTMCECSKTIWRERLRAYTKPNRHPVKCSRWRCSQCGYAAAGFYHFSFFPAKSVRIALDACDRCYRGEDFTMFDFAEKHP